MTRRHGTLIASMLLSVLLLGAAAAVASGREEAAADSGPSGSSADSVPDLEISLRQGSLFEAATPPAVRRNQSFPGERPALQRAHPEAPPVTPHGVSDFLPITREQNLCTDCHLVEEKGEGLPTPIPKSHFVDPSAPGTVQEEIVGARWLCTSCHVAQTDNPPLVGNRVTGVGVSSPD